MSTLFQRFSIIQQNQQNQHNQQNQPHKIYYLKIKSKHYSTKIFKNFKIFQQKISQSKNFRKSMSHDFWKFMVHEFFEIHGP